MDSLLPVINRLQDVFGTIGYDSIDLPQIVVIGSQSSGKSSVLENVVGREFLPRGSGIVTRRPLVLQLINTPDETTEWGEFAHKARERFTNFNAIREEIERETDRKTGKNKGISPEPISLKIYSPHVLNLTLVDLPGITRVPIGDQPKDIEEQIRQMIFTYIQKPNAIILAVTAANTDLTNSDAIHIAREVDPEGVRTLGVLTKIDIMNPGDDAMDMLTGKVVPLKMGFIGVINRSQADIQARKPIREALKYETEFFSNHRAYRTIANRQGTLHLAKTLNKILLNHIRDCLPDLKARVLKLSQEAQAEMATYGDSALEGKANKGALLLQIITKFSTDYRDTIDGKLAEISLSELFGGARINYIFNEVYGACINEIQPNDSLTINEIRTAIKNATGPRSALFLPEVSFDLLVKKQILRLEEPSLQCTDLVFDELQRIVTHVESKELHRYAVLKERVVEVVHGLLHRCRGPTKEMIKNLIQIQLAHVNTDHPDFIPIGEAYRTTYERLSKPQGPPQPNPAQQQQQLQREQQMREQQQREQQQREQQQREQQQREQQQQQGPSQQQNQQRDQQAPAPGSTAFFNMFFGSNPSAPQPAPTANQPKAAPQAQPSRQANGPGGAGSYNNNNPYAPQPQPQPHQPPQQNTAFGRHNADRLEHVPSTLRTASKISDKEQFETELIQSLILSYFNIVRKNVKDQVPKAIMFFLVNETTSSVQNELVTNLYKEELFAQLLSESPEIETKRKECRERLDVFKKANEVLNEVRDFNVK
eukprot:TRINITY_DN3115_c0_g1_i1.p1 TRINITY_DN3115_c0_g1~~TRINITY_DN3115_c0_g1_i1.p1  ORF type:complete len:777 (+),score=202.82 TRINITY_DN3115_c0_g1_i1:35-2332(+)